MEYLGISLIAGFLTILAPCVFPTLPVILGVGVRSSSRSRPFLIFIGLVMSIVLFSTLIRFIAFAIGLDIDSLRILSAFIIILFGLNDLFPHFWEGSRVQLWFNSISGNIFTKFSNNEANNNLDAFFMGMSLGPLVSSCSPTFLLVLAVILPANYIIGLINIIVFALGLGLVVLLISIFGQNILKSLKWMVDNNSWGRKWIAGILIFVGLLIITGLDREIDSILIDYGIPTTTQFETNLLNNL